MNIAVNGKFLTQKLTGVQRVAWETLLALTEILKESDVKVTIFTPNQNIESEEYNLSALNVKIARGKTKGILWEQTELYYKSKKFDYLLNFCNQAPLLSQNSITFIHDAQVYLYPESYSKAFVAWYKITLPVIAKNAKHLITVSEYSKSKLVEALDVDESKIDVLYNGSQHLKSAYSIENVSVNIKSLSETKYCLMIGSLAGHKNIKSVIEAFENVGQDLKLVIVGDLDNQVFNSNGITYSQNLILTGRVNDDEIKFLMNHCSQFISPSLFEGFGLPVVEALIMDKPVLCSDIDTYRELFDGYVKFIKPLDVSSWQKGIVEAANDKSKPDVSKKDIMNRFNWNSNAERILQTMVEGNGHAK